MELYLSTRQHDLARDEDKEHNLRLDHTVDQAREELQTMSATTDATQHRPTYLGLIRAELSVRVRKSLQTNGELNVTGAHDVLNLELGELGVEAKLLDDTRILARRQPRVVFRLRTRDDHLARREDERGGLGVADTHDDRGKTL